MIHKVSVRDRLVHHAVYRILYPIFDRSFIFDSYSCRNSKGIYMATNWLDTFVRKVSRNFTSPCYALNFDIKKFFDLVDYEILLSILSRKLEKISSRFASLDDDNGFGQLMHLLGNICRKLSKLSNIRRGSVKEIDGMKKSTDRKSDESIICKYLHGCI